MPTLSFRKYLLEARSRVEKGEVPSWIVLGNEAADLDSTVSCLVTAYALYLQHESTQPLCVPVLPLSQTKFPLRNDIVKYFNHLQLPWEEVLYFLEYLVLLPIHFDSSTFSVFLVDANELPSTLSSSSSSSSFHFWSTKVKAILDHHEDLNSYRLASPRKITQVMSATTLVILEFFPLFNSTQCDFQTLTFLSQLCIAPLIVDTQNWRSATHLDHEALQTLLPYLPCSSPSSTSTSLTSSSVISDWMNQWFTQLRTWKTQITCSIPLWLEKDLKRYRVGWNVPSKSGSTTHSKNSTLVTTDLNGSSSFASLLGCYDIASIPHSLRTWVQSPSICHDIQFFFQEQLQKQSNGLSSTQENETEEKLSYLLFSILSTQLLDSIETTTSSSSSSTQVERFFLFITHLEKLHHYFHDALMQTTDLDLVPYTFNLEYWSSAFKVQCYQVKTPELTRKKLQPKLDDILKSILPLVVLN